MIGLVAVARSLKTHVSSVLTNPRAPWFLWNPLLWIGHHFRLAELIWFLERRHLADPSPTGELPHVDTLMSRGGGGAMGGMMNETPVVKDLVLVGAGHSHAFVLKSFGMRPEPNVRVTLISDGVDTPYSGMLPGFVAGLYTRDECHIDAIKLAEFANARMIIGRAEKIESDRVIIEGQPDVYFDVCSVDVGSSPQLPEYGSELISPVKPIARFSEHLHRIVERDKSGLNYKLAVVGGGAGGVELFLALSSRLENASDLLLVSRDGELVSSHGTTVRKLVGDAIGKSNRHRVLLGYEAEGVERDADGQLQLVLRRTRDGSVSRETADEVVWCTSACGQKLLKASSGFTVDEAGFVIVNDYLQVEGRDNVFAAGDCAHLRSNPVPKAGVFAVREGPPLAENIRSVLRGRIPSEKYVPQKSFLGLIGTGDKRAIASKGDMGLEGEWLWGLKDWIDRKWLSGYTTMLTRAKTPRELELESLSLVAQSSGSQVMEEMCDAKMRCGGCGSKVGSSVLSRVLGQVSRKATREDILLGLDDPDDCAILKAGTDGVAIQSVDFFKAFWRDEFIFGRIAANHSMSDIHAMGSAPTAAMCIAVVPFAPSTKIEQRLVRLMKGAVAQLDEEQCALVGGHTCEGAEVSLGFSVTSTSHISLYDSVLTKHGMRPNDILILTKPIGTGVIMAAHMRLAARGRWVASALDSMVESNREAGLSLARLGATACTDVTGFGLAGHLVEMLKSSSRERNCPLVARLNLESIPFLDGAVECVRDAKITSSIHRENARAAHLVHGATQWVEDPRFTLLFDPQTAGGLLASVPFNRAEYCLEQLKLRYGNARIIGKIEEAAQGDSSGAIIFISK